MVFDEAGGRSGGTLVPIECVGLPSEAVQGSVHDLQPSDMTGSHAIESWI